MACLQSPLTHSPCVDDVVPVARGPLRQLEESLDEEDARVADLALAVGVLLGGEVEAALEHVLVPLAVGEPGAGREGQCV